MLFREYLGRLAASADPLHFALVDAASGKAAGTAALMRFEPLHGVIEVGYISFSPLLKNTRASTEAMYLLMAYVFDELKYRRYEWKCDSLNAPSRSAAKRLGFQFEGIFRNAVVYKNRSRDTAWFSITDAEWPAVRKGFELWLDPDNFDAAGCQRRGLAAIRDHSRRRSIRRIAPSQRKMTFRDSRTACCASSLEARPHATTRSMAWRPATEFAMNCTPDARPAQRAPAEHLHSC